MLIGNSSIPKFSHARFIFGTLLCLGLHARSGGASVPPVAGLSSQELAAKVNAAYNLPPFSMHMEWRSSISGATRSVNPTIIRSDLFVDHDRFDATRQVSSIVEGNEVKQFERRALWADGVFLARQQDVQDGLAVQAFFSHVPDQHFLTSPESGPALFGNFLGTSASDMIAHATTTSRVRDAVVGGANCLVIQGSGSNGKFTFWIDGQSFLIRKASIEKNSGDTAWDRKLPYVFPTEDGGSDSEESDRVEFDDVVIKQVQGVWVPVSGKLEITSTYKSGTEVTHETSQRTNVVFNPNFAALRAFQMDGLPDGIVVHPLHSNEYMPHVWHDGKLQLDGTPQVVWAVDNALRDNSQRMASSAIGTDSTSNSTAPSKPKVVAAASSFSAWGKIAIWLGIVLGPLGVFICFKKLFSHRSI
jgi:hypothetical protein